MGVFLLLSKSQHKKRKLCVCYGWFFDWHYHRRIIYQNVFNHSSVFLYALLCWFNFVVLLLSISCFFHFRSIFLLRNAKPCSSSYLFLAFAHQKISFAEEKGSEFNYQNLIEMKFSILSEATERHRHTDFCDFNKRDQMNNWAFGCTAHKNGKFTRMGKSDSRVENVRERASRFSRNSVFHFVSAASGRRLAGCGGCFLNIHSGANLFALWMFIRFDVALLIRKAVKWWLITFIMR